ncbi:MAG: hypothetical protein CMH98_04910 [Oceanospirillaceae bacterium]|nr:hypothetical protein [Oceanospirillaceae bacterium]
MVDGMPMALRGRVPRMFERTRVPNLSEVACLAFWKGRGCQTSLRKNSWHVRGDVKRIIEWQYPISARTMSPMAIPNLCQDNRKGAGAEPRQYKHLACQRGATAERLLREAAL